MLDPPCGLGRDLNTPAQLAEASAFDRDQVASQVANASGDLGIVAVGGVVIDLWL